MRRQTSVETSNGEKGQGDGHEGEGEGGPDVRPEGEDDVVQLGRLLGVQAHRVDVGTVDVRQRGHLESSSVSVQS